MKNNKLSELVSKAKDNEVICFVVYKKWAIGYIFKVGIILYLQVQSSKITKGGLNRGIIDGPLSINVNDDMKIATLEDFIPLGLNPPPEYRESKFYVNYVTEEGKKIYARMITEHRADGQILSHLVKTEDDLEIIPIHHALKPWPLNKCSWDIKEFMGDDNYVELEVV